MKIIFQNLNLFFLIVTFLTNFFISFQSNRKFELLVAQQAQQILELEELVCFLNKSLLLLQVKLDKLVEVKSLENSSISTVDISISSVGSTDNSLDSLAILGEVSSYSASQLIFGFALASCLGYYGYYNYSTLSSAAQIVAYSVLAPDTVDWFLSFPRVTNIVSSYSTVFRSQADIDLIKAQIDALFK